MAHDLSTWKRAVALNTIYSHIFAAPHSGKIMTRGDPVPKGTKLLVSPFNPNDADGRYQVRSAQVEGSPYFILVWNSEVEEVGDEA